MNRDFVVFRGSLKKYFYYGYDARVAIYKAALNDPAKRR